VAVKSVLRGAIDPIGHLLAHVIDAFKITAMLKRFWHLDCKEGSEWNFAYILSKHSGLSTKLVLPKSLQIGWIELPLYFLHCIGNGL
jgi:hypothetical protein